MSVQLRRERSGDRAALALERFAPEDRTWIAMALRLGARVKHSTLIQASGHEGFERCHRLVELLADQGRLVIEESRSRSTAPWRAVWVRWHDWEGVCAQLGIETPNKRTSTVAAGSRAPWFDADVQAVANEVALRPARVGAPSRVHLLRRLDVWSSENRRGTWRDFALFALGDTKAVTTSQRAWLECKLDMGSLGVESHLPLTLISGPMRIDSDAGTLEMGSQVFAGLEPAWWQGLRAVEWREGAPCDGYVVVENRTTFDRLVKVNEGRCIVLWCPGYPPSYWRDAVSRLLHVAPLPASVFCDPDPAGIDIALKVGELWRLAGADWSPWRMGPDVLQQASVLRELSPVDHLQLDRLSSQGLPPMLDALARDMRLLGKAEQEGLA
jgi:hypothetical protein